jgi:hypothetical protein
VKVSDQAAGERSCRRRASRAQRGSNAVANTRVPGKGASLLYMIPLERWNVERSVTSCGKRDVPLWITSSSLTYKRLVEDGNPWNAGTWNAVVLPAVRIQRKDDLSSFIHI